MRTVLAVVLLLGSLLVGCGSDAAEETGAPSADEPAAPTDADGPTVATATTHAGAPTVPPLHPSIDGYPETVVTLAGPDGSTEEVAVKVADTPARRQHGLMEVEELPAGTGMLFVFGEDREGGFWMKDTLVPLSIAFVAADGDVLEILQMEPCEEDPCPVYDPGVTYRYTLEVPAGWFADLGVDEGWTLQRPLPTPSVHAPS